MKRNRAGLVMSIALVLMGILVAGCSAAQAAPASTGHAVMPDAPANAALVKVPHQLYDPSTRPASADKVKEITLTVEQKTSEIAPDVPYEAWTFNGSVPGPILRVRQGDQVKFTLINNGSMEHSIDFHAAQTAWSINYQNVKVGGQESFTWTANYPGIFMYHCGTPPAIAHIASGMYGAIIVEPAEALPPAKEYVLVQSEFYAKQGTDGIFHYDGAKVMAVQPDYVVFNGYANQYKDNPLTADPGQRIRIWILNAGPSDFSAFHIVGAIFDKAYPDGNPQNVETGRQTVTVPPGGGYMVELTVPDAGLYPIVTHSFADASKGALGFLNVGNVTMQAGMSH
jgi:nitrite reductase (NO-forming)